MCNIITLRTLESRTVSRETLVLEAVFDSPAAGNEPPLTESVSGRRINAVVTDCERR